jgi:hypothetical protein
LPFTTVVVQWFCGVLLACGVSAGAEVAEAWGSDIGFTSRVSWVGKVAATSAMRWALSAPLSLLLAVPEPSGCGYALLPVSGYCFSGA